MNAEKWENLIYKVEEKFGIDKRYEEEFTVAETSTGQIVLGKRESVEFKSPLGRIKLEKTSRPKVIDKKVLHTKRIGSKSAIDFIYSDTEQTSQLKIFKINSNDEWEEINPESMGFN
ncbi:MAG: hypothetical protein WC499_03565 [Patescibacteria group bacterium]